MHLRELDANLVVVLDALLTEASVTKAAARLGRSPSAVSHSLANLREVFADELFVRAGQKLVPTAKALQLAPTIHVIVSGMEGLLRPTAPFDPATQTGAYGLACQDIRELTLLHELRQILKVRAPGLVLNWKPLGPDQSFEDLRNGETDFVILEGEVSENAAEFMWLALTQDRYVTLARPGHPLSARDPSTADFAEAEHILLSGAAKSGSTLEAHLAAHDVMLETSTRVSSAFVGMFIAWRSDGLITVPETVADAVADQLPFARVRQPFPAFVAETKLVWHRRHNRDECHNWLRQEIAACCQGPARRT